MDTAPGTHELLTEQLARILYAERQMVRGLNMMIEAARSEELRQALRNHLDETHAHASRLEELLQELDATSSGVTCMGIDGLVEEIRRDAERHGAHPSVDLAFIATAQKIELYEVAAYRSICALAEQLKLNGVLLACDAILGQERNADATLTDLLYALRRHASKPMRAAPALPQQSAHA